MPLGDMTALLKALDSRDRTCSTPAEVIAACQVYRDEMQEEEAERKREMEAIMEQMQAEKETLKTIIFF